MPVVAVWRVAIVALVAVCLTACSGSETAGGSGGSSTGATASLDPKVVRQASQAWADIQAKRDQLGQVEAALVRQCMVGKGFTVFPPTPTATPDDGGDVTFSPTLSAARSVGYGLDPRLHGAGASSPSAATSWDSVPDDYKARLSLAELGPPTAIVSYDTGDTKVAIPTSGCLGDVRKQLYGDLNAYIRLSWLASNQISGQIRAELSKDAALSRLTPVWSACMKGKGYPAGSHADAVSRAYLAYNDSSAPPADLNAARALETSIAVADAECAQTTGYRVEQVRATARANAVVLARNTEAVIAWRDLVVQALTRGADRLKR